MTQRFEPELPPLGEELPSETHALRALELIRLAIDDKGQEAAALFEMVPGKDYLGLASAAISAAAMICRAAGSEFCIAYIDYIKEGLDA